MSYKIQITVDEQLNNTLKSRAKEMGLSVSSYARLALLRVVVPPVINQAIEDVKSNNTETLTLAEFNHQLDNL